MLTKIMLILQLAVHKVLVTAMEAKAVDIKVKFVIGRTLYHDSFHDGVSRPNNETTSCIKFTLFKYKCVL